MAIVFYVDLQGLAQIEEGRIDSLRKSYLESDICETYFRIKTDQTFNLFSQLNVLVISQISLRMLSKRQPVLSYHGLSNGLIMQERAAACPTCYQEAHTCFLNAV